MVNTLMISKTRCKQYRVICVCQHEPKEDKSYSYYDQFYPAKPYIYAEDWQNYELVDLDFAKRRADFMYNKEKDIPRVFRHWVVVEDICEPRKVWNNKVLRSKMIYSADPDFDFESFN